MNKQILLIIPIAIFFVFTFITSCSSDYVCEQCHLESVDDSTGQVSSSGEIHEFCDSELEEIKLEAPVKFGNSTTKWVCE